MQKKLFSLNSIWQPSHETPAYLLIVLHGRGDSAEGYRGFQAELNLPGLSCLLLNAPDRSGTGFSWYDSSPNQLPGILRSQVLLEKLFKEIHQAGIPPERCFLFGFSQGCLMTEEFGSRYPHALAGYIGISGYCYDPDKILEETTQPIKSAPWLIHHGIHDDVLPIETTRNQIKRLIAGGFNIEYKEYVKDHSFLEPTEIDDIREWIRKRMV